MDLKNIKTIIFDFGGVVVDINRDSAVKRFKEVGVDEADSLLDTYRQEGIFLALEEGKLSRHEFYDELRKLAGKQIANERIDYAWKGFFLHVDQGRLDFLTELRKNYRVCLLSNTNPIVMAWARSSQFSPAGKPLDDYFDKLYLSYQMGVAKPHREIFEQVIQSENLAPSQMLFIDDGAANIEMATSLGFQTAMPKHGEDFRIYF